MLPGPVFHSELLVISRRGRYYVLRFLYGLLLLLGVGLNDTRFNRFGAATETSTVSIQEMAATGQSIFACFVVTQTIAVLILTPALVAGVIADERQRKTLHYLLSSCLSSAEIVIGKLAARLLFTSVFLSIGLPVMVMLSFFGGVDPNEVLLLFATSAALMFFLGSLAILISTHAKKAREAVSLSYLTVMVWLFAPSILAIVMPTAGGEWSRMYVWIQPVNTWLVASSPISLLSNLRSWQNFTEYVLTMMGVQVGFGAVMLAIAVLRLRPVFRNELVGPRGLGKWIPRREQGRGKGRFRFLRRPECGDDALLWKELFVSRTSPVTKALTSIVLIGVSLLLIYFCYDSMRDAFNEVRTHGYGVSGTDQARGSFNTILRVVLTLLYLCLAIGAASASSSSLSGEREEDTWISLIASPVTALEIIRGKMLGALWSVRWIAALWLAFGLIGLVVGSIHPLGFLAAIILTLVYTSFACALGIAFSLRAKSSSRALASTLGTLIFVNGVYLFFLIPLQPDTMLVMLGVTPMFEAASIATYREVANLLETGRSIGSRDRIEDGMALSFFVYALATVVIVVRSVTSFDQINDRPDDRRTTNAKTNAAAPR